MDGLLSLFRIVFYRNSCIIKANSVDSDQMPHHFMWLNTDCQGYFHGTPGINRLSYPKIPENLNYPKIWIMWFYNTDLGPVILSENFQTFLTAALNCNSYQNESDTIKSIWTASNEFGTYRLFEPRRFRRACASAQSRQNLRCSLIQKVSQEEPSDRKPDPWPLWMAGHVQLKFVMTECSKTQIRLTRLI